VILDQDTGDEVQFPNQEGTLFIRSPWPGIARTVYGDHERFREIYFGRYPGMFFTGDAARRDEDGYYRVTGRIDEVINVSGYRLGPFEAECALVAHPMVDEAAVVGFPDKLKGQGIYAFVKLARGAVRSEELKRELVGRLRLHIGPVATPDVIQWADALPKTRSGKVLRKLLSTIAAGEVENLGDLSIISNPDAVEGLVKERLGLCV
jgi:acetyl-CoA synthetase